MKSRVHGLSGERALMQKGITQIIGTLLLLMVVVVVTSMAYLFFVGMQANTQEKVKESTEGVLQASQFRIENINPDTMKISIRNTGSYSIANSSLRFYVDGVPKDCAGLSNIPAGKAKTCEIFPPPCLLTGTKTLKVTGKQYEQERSFAVSLRYCMDVFQYSEFVDAKSYIIINGTVRMNDETNTPYSNKEIGYQLDNLQPDSIMTDSSGKFSIRKEWNFSYLPPLSVWSLPFEYVQTSSPTPITGGPASPDWTVEYDDGKTTNTNMMGFKLKHAVSGQVAFDKILLSDREIIPVMVNKTHVRFDISQTVNISDMPPRDGTEAWFGYFLLQPNSIQDATCMDTAFAKCFHGISTVTSSTSSVNDRVYGESDTIDYNYTITNPTNYPLFIYRLGVSNIFYSNSTVTDRSINIWSTPCVTHLKNTSVRLNPGESKDFEVKIGISCVINQLRTTYKNPDMKPNGRYKVDMMNSMPEWGFNYLNERFTFCINDCDGVSGAYPSVYYSSHVFMWNYTNPIRGSGGQDLLSKGIYVFNSSVTYIRPTGTGYLQAGSNGNEIFMFVNKTNSGLLTAENGVWGSMWTFSHTAGPGTDNYRVNSFYPLYIPAIDNTKNIWPHLVTKIKEVSYNGVEYTLRLVAKAYLINYNENQQSDNITIYKRTGYFVADQAKAFSGPGETFTYSIPIRKPTAGEVREIYLSYNIGSHTSITNFIKPNITVYINGQKFREHFFNGTYSVNCSKVAEDTCYYYLRFLWYADVSEWVPQDADTLEVKFVSGDGSGSGSVGTGAWIRYKIAEPLWKNEGIHTAVFETTQNEAGVGAGKYTYKFDA
ncbi:MAG: hypothetical protein HZB67_05735 [Candidatus Aenigmarchaeota archaeon]|nr:hypothetical protein [Candidatus Aenigmarchaeota archaeon]